MAKEYVPYDGPVVTRGEALAQNLKWYFNGKLCSHGHLSLRRTSTKFCNGCDLDQRRRAREKTAMRAAIKPLTARQEASLAGLTRYHSDRPCSKGHVGLRSVAGRGCVECADERRRNLPKGKVNEYARAWRKRNPEASKAAIRRHNVANRKKRREQARLAYAENREKGKTRTKCWRLRNPEGVRAHAMTRIARKKGAIGSYSATDVRHLGLSQKWRCASCRKSIKNKFHVDHIEPLSKGGRNDRTNLQLLCPFCNISKHNADPFEWAQRNGRLL